MKINLVKRFKPSPEDEREVQHIPVRARIFISEDEDPRMIEDMRRRAGKSGAILHVIPSDNS